MKKEKIDIMVDIETLGIKDDATILQISAIPFNISTGEIVELNPDTNFIGTFNRTNMLSGDIDISVDGDTLKWWLKTNPNLLLELSKGDRVGAMEDERKLIIEFSKWLKYISKFYEIKLWANGILFDNLKIKKKMDLYSQKYPVRYNNDMCMRSVLYMASMISGMSISELWDTFDDGNLERHNAYTDCLSQIKVLSGCYKMLLP